MRVISASHRTHRSEKLDQNTASTAIVGETSFLLRILGKAGVSEGLPAAPNLVETL